eukprot:TRINITY_DN75468_c0_g1_i1.p1 TRINITY_DN75468_c0_g1~~TRINITY_DN75468_c0_g1_i1.p1  ORF type:complete len:307 (+),score=45.11 TRINITY_DN75468_c0_g1_i1:82-1002(+)
MAKLSAGQVSSRELLPDCGDESETSSGLGSHDSEDACDASRLKAVVCGLLLVCLLVGGFVYREAVEAFFGSALDWIIALGPWAALLLVLLIATLTIFMLPVFPIIVGAGVELVRLYGDVVGSGLAIASVTLGMWLGGIMAFQLGRTVWRQADHQHGEHGEFLTVVHKMIEKEGTIIVFLARMSPLLPAEVFNYACSLTSLTLWQYAIGCTGSVVPVAFWVIASSQAAQAVTGDSEDEDASGKGAGASRVQRICLVVLNVAVLLVITSLFYRWYTRFRDELRREEAGKMSDSGTTIISATESSDSAS